MAIATRTSHQSHALICWIAAAAVVLAGTVLLPLSSSNPSPEPGPLVAAYDDTTAGGKGVGDQFREYLMRDGKPVLTRLRVNLSSSTFVPRSEELQQLQELTIDSPSLSKLSLWFSQIDSPLQHLETLSISCGSTENETARDAELMSGILETIAQKSPAIITLKLEYSVNNDDTSGCPAPRIGDRFPRLKHLVCIGFDCRDCMRTMIGQADLESLAILDRAISREAFFSQDDLNAIADLDLLKRLSLINCVCYASDLSDVIRARQLKELNLRCREVDSLTGFGSLGTLRIGFAGIQPSAIGQFADLKKLHTLEFLCCVPMGRQDSPAFRPPPNLKRLTLSDFRAFSEMMPVVLNTPLHDVELSVEVEKLYLDDMPLVKNVHHLHVVCPRDAEVIEAITHLEQLRSLNCDVWNASPELLSRLFHMKSLKNLNLTCGLVPDFEAALSDDMLQQSAAARPHCLEEISLRLGDLQVHSFCRLLASLHALKTVTLEGPDLNGNDLRPLRACRDLRTLNLVDCIFEHGVKEELAALPYLQNLRIENCWSPAETSPDGNRWLHLEQLQFVDEVPFDANHVTADRFLIGRRWSKWDRPSVWLFEEEVE